MENDIAMKPVQFESPAACLKSVFGYDTFKPLQEKVIQSAMDGHDALVILPTGGGKSLCFQVPALCSDGLTLVISPLIALMNDQVQALQQSGVEAHAIHSHIGEDEKYVIHSKLQDGTLKLLYVSPEKLMSPSFLSYITGYTVRYIAIDEAHCVSIWGNDFRPEYTKLAILRESFPKATFMALTATADRSTQEDIIEQLKLKEPHHHVGSFERENIFIESREGTRRYEQIIQFLSERKDTAGIIYCLSRKSTENISSKLNNDGYKTGYYHAGMTADQRNDVQKKFQNDDVPIICATIAFGMGIDKSNIRWIIHYNMPKNIEGFYQEIGRAGRDGLPANSLLFSGWGDFLKLQNFIEDSEAEELFKNIQKSKLERMREFGSTGDCRTNVILNYFDEYRTEDCGHCDNCLNPPVKFDGTVLAQKALSAMLRSNEEVGLALLIDVLRGSRRSEVVRRNLHMIKTYGSGKDLSSIQWRSYLNQLLNQGIIRMDYADSFSLKTTPLSTDVLKGKKPVELTEAGTFEKKKLPRFKKRTKTEDFKQDLMDKLKAWRLQKARLLGIPPYTIFHDSSLEALASTIPTLKSDLLSLHGFGEIKVEKYGDEILVLVQNYVDNQTHLKKVRGQTYYETFKLYQDGKSVEDIAKNRELSIATIYTHLAKLFDKGEAVDLSKYITAEQLAMIKKVWESNEKPENIRELKPSLPEDFPYHLIHIGVSILKNRQ